MTLSKNKKQITSIILFFYGFFAGNIQAQPNTPETAKVLFGIYSQTNATAYPFGQLPANLPKGTYSYLSADKFGKTQDAFKAYVEWKRDFVEACSNGSYRVKFQEPDRTVSEGIAYGMLLAVYAADKPLFDGLYLYYELNSNANGIMGWNRTGCLNGNAGLGGNGGATDAELDVAMALIIANCQWPGQTSPYDYALEATLLINAIKTFEIHPISYQTINGDGWGMANACRNPSYFSPAYYKEFAKHVPTDADFWENFVVNATYDFLTTNRNEATGLVSNWANNNAAPNNCNGPIDYGFDACRMPWRLATDVLWYNDARAKAILSKTNAWLKGYSTTCKGPIALNASNPAAGNGSHISTFVSTWAVGTMSSDDSKLLQDFYTETVKVTTNDYFGNTLRALMLFMLSGNFWQPCPEVSYVQMVNFSTSSYAGQTSLAFQTQIELKNSFFNVYFSTDQQNFTFIGSFSGLSDSKEITAYTFNDERYFEGNGYYRITFIDEFGNEHYLNETAVSRKDPIEATFFPNPFEDQQKIYISAPNDAVLKVRLVDMRGRIIFDREAFPINQEVTLDLDLADGTYLVMIPYGKKNYSFKIQKR